MSNINFLEATEKHLIREQLRKIDPRLVDAWEEMLARDAAQAHRAGRPYELAAADFQRLVEEKRARDEEAALFEEFKRARGARKDVA